MEDLIISVLYRTLVAGTPLLLATTGEVITERSGVLNLGLEGMMALGAVTGFISALATGNPYMGMLVSLLAGAGMALIHGFASITLRANQTVSGLALSMLGLGLAGLWGKPYIGRSLPWRFEAMEIPLLHKIPFLGPVLFQQNIFFYLSLLLALLAWFMIYHTAWGISLRSCGENPRAVEAQGGRIYGIRYGAVALGGALTGLAGANLSLAYSKSWMENMTAGRGWIAIALTIFALWNPLRAMLGAFLFGGIFVMQYLIQPLGVSPNFLAMLPYLTTLLFLVYEGMGRKSRMHAPSVLGEPYKKGER